MVTRRNIRVKVMQALYEVSGETPSGYNAEKVLKHKLQQTPKLFTYLIYFLTEVARYAEKDALQRASRHLTTTEDLNINTKLAGNSLLWQLLENASYQQALSSFKFKYDSTENAVKKVYNDLIISEKYRSYISQPSRDAHSEKDILSFIFTDLMLPDEVFVSHIEDYFSNWDDDAQMLSLLMPGILQKPASLNLQQMPDKEKADFAIRLLQTVTGKKDYVSELINMRLKNWDPERIAMLDMILMQMGVSEFLFFSTIPAKVTINEYIDLAKDYSTAQSGQFVNGILDGIYKDLTSQNKINKSDFKPKKAK